MNEPIQFYSPDDIARHCGVTRRHALRLIRSVLDTCRTRYRLNHAEFKTVCGWHDKFGYKRDSQKK